MRPVEMFTKKAPSGGLLIWCEIPF